jgi:phospholipid/cholesterol/gamma-HCH transport system permease protein
MQQTGLHAVPIVALMGFLIGIVLAFQGASQLEQFGAEIYVVDLISISMLRELGILLTAIIVAGRSASAFTAAIGSMKMREEIEAMRVLGLDPIELLVLPRVLATLILLPVLGFIASMAGLLGGALMAWIDLGISPALFRTQLAANTSVTHALVGLSKSPAFAMIIALVGCYQGLQVEGNTDSLGSRTSRSVVVAIFLVIVVDALASIFFSVWGV